MSVEEDTGERETSRVHVGFMTIHGSEETSLRVSLPKNVALSNGFEPGDVCPVQFDGVHQEFIFQEPGSEA